MRSVGLSVEKIISDTMRRLSDRIRLASGRAFVELTVEGQFVLWDRASRQTAEWAEVGGPTGCESE